MPIPDPKKHEILLKVSVCGVCHTELDEIEGRTPPSQLPIIPGHQVVGRVVKQGPGASRWKTGDRVGIAWIHSACGVCNFCKSGMENLCDDFKATGRDAHGGYAEYTTVHENVLLTSYRNCCPMRRQRRSYAPEPSAIDRFVLPRCTMGTTWVLRDSGPRHTWC